MNFFSIIILSYFTIIFCFVIVSIHLFIAILILIAGKDRVLDHVDTLLVLGNSLKENQITELLKYRLDTAIELTKRYPNVKVIVSGGKTHNSTISEAKVMKDYLICHGVTNMIIEEDQSKDTYENILFSKDLINVNQPVMIITNRFHIYRSILLAKKLGYKVVGSKAAKTGRKALYYYLYEIYAFYIFKKEGKL